MCGIIGSVNLGFDDSILDLIRRRGPDDSGLVRQSLNRNYVIFGHRRLSIVDLSPAGHQPMFTMDQQFVIIFNGEIYNHLELRRKLSDVNFKGHSDTETILYYIAKYGPSAVSDFNGIFSFAFLDLKNETLLLCRDPFGVKPLYYWQKSNKLIFSSEIRVIQQMAHDSVDLDNLAELLCLRYSPSPDTLFKKIQKVRPGHTVAVNLSGSELAFSASSYISSEQFHLVKPVAYKEAVEQYGVLLKQAVDRQLMSDVEVGILLSGGIDSALIANFAQAATDYPMKAFTVGFKEQDDCDEIADAQETATILGLDSVITRVGYTDFLEIMQSCISIVEEPLATTSIIPMYYLSQLAARDVKVVLSGQGADESLGGYGRYQGELYRRFIPPFLAATGKQIVNLMGLKNEQINRGLLALQFDDDMSRFLSAYSVFKDDEIEKLIGCRDTKSQERLQYFYDQLSCTCKDSSVERMMAIDMRMNLADDLLLYTDKVTMHFSLECRVPMLDLELVKFIQSLPYYYRLKIGKPKIIHRELAKSVLHEAIIKRKKKGFQSPTQKWFSGYGPVWEMLLAKGSKFANYFDHSEVKKVLLAHENGTNKERHIFLLLSLYYWLEEFV